MMVLTMNDPPRFDPYALPLLAAAIIALAGLLGAPGFRMLPLAPILFCLAAIAGSLVARGSAYAGRFSIHMIGVACTVTTCAVAAALCKIPFTRSTSSSF
jgi:hypothetical protein